MCYGRRWLKCKFKPPKKSNTQTMEEVHKKINWHKWGSHILTSILMSNMKVTKIVQKHFLWTFWGFLVTIIWDIKIDINMCEPHYVNVFFVNLLHSPCVWLFDIWYLFDNLTSFWQLHIFLTFATWSTFVVMCWIMCNFLNTAWIFKKILLDIDVDVFYLNIVWFFHDGFI